MTDPGVPRSAASRQFVVIWGLTLTIVVVLIFPLVTFFLINWFDDPDIRWIKEIQSRKFRIAESVTAKDRILITGGSSGLFGVDAELLQMRLGRPVINVASHAGLGLRYLLDDARQAARPGDTLLLHIEYSLYGSSPLLTEIERRYCWTYASHRLFHLPLALLVRQFYGNSFPTYLESWQGWNLRLAGTLPKSEPPLWTQYPYVFFGPCGDFRGEVHPHAPIAEAHLEKELSGIAPSSRQMLEDFFLWAQKRGIRLIGLFPAVLQYAGPIKPVPAVFETIRNFYKSHGLVMLGDADFVQMPRELFLDTCFHANSAGRRLHTEMLAQELQTELNSKPSRRNNAIFLLHDPYWKAGSKDLTTDFTDCRFLSTTPLPHASCITPAKVSELSRKGTAIYFDDPSVGEILQAQGIGNVVERQSTSTLADWIKDYPRHYFLLSISGGAKIPGSSSELPEPFAEFCHDEAPVRVAILGTGPFSRVHKVSSGKEFSQVIQKTRPRWAHASPLEYTATAWPFSESHPESRPLMVERHYVVENAAQGDLAVCVADPNLGIVVQRGTFHEGRHLDSELRRVIAQ